jgi:hypothetical protein
MQQNKMGAKQLAIVIAPNILRAEDDLSDPVAVVGLLASTNQVVFKLITDFIEHPNDYLSVLGKDVVQVQEQSGRVPASAWKSIQPNPRKKPKLQAATLRRPVNPDRAPGKPGHRNTLMPGTFWYDEAQDTNADAASFLSSYTESPESFFVADEPKLSMAVSCPVILPTSSPATVVAPISRVKDPDLPPSLVVSSPEPAVYPFPYDVEEIVNFHVEEPEIVHVVELGVDGFVAEPGSRVARKSVSDNFAKFITQRSQPTLASSGAGDLHNSAWKRGVIKRRRLS